MLIFLMKVSNNNHYLCISKNHLRQIIIFVITFVLLIKIINVFSSWFGFEDFIDNLLFDSSSGIPITILYIIIVVIITGLIDKKIFSS